MIRLFKWSGAPEDHNINLHRREKFKSQSINQTKKQTNKHGIRVYIYGLHFHLLILLKMVPYHLTYFVMMFLHHLQQFGMNLEGFNIQQWVRSRIHETWFPVSYIPIVGNSEHFHGPLHSIFLPFLRSPTLQQHFHSYWLDYRFHISVMRAAPEGLV
jgi:hypothetical protein